MSYRTFERNLTMEAILYCSSFSFYDRYWQWPLVIQFKYGILTQINLYQVSSERETEKCTEMLCVAKLLCSIVLAV